MHREHLIELEDACVVELEGGKIHIKQAVDLTAMGAETATLAAKFNREKSCETPDVEAVRKLGFILAIM